MVFRSIPFEQNGSADELGIDVSSCCWSLVDFLVDWYSLGEVRLLRNQDGVRLKQRATDLERDRYSERTIGPQHHPFIEIAHGPYQLPGRIP